MKQVGKSRRPCLVAYQATLSQKWPPPPRNVADSCELSETTETTSVGRGGRHEAGGRKGGREIKQGKERERERVVLCQQREREKERESGKERDGERFKGKGGGHLHTVA